jgi:hypothetical protein
MKTTFIDEDVLVVIYLYSRDNLLLEPVALDVVYPEIGFSSEAFGLFKKTY